MRSFYLILFAFVFITASADRGAEAARHKAKHLIKHHRAMQQVKFVAKKTTTVSVVAPLATPTALPSATTSPVPTLVATPPLVTAPPPSLPISAPSNDLQTKVMEYNNKIGEAQANAKSFDINLQLAHDYLAQANKVRIYGFWQNGAVVAMPDSPMAEEEAGRLVDESTQATIKARQGLDNCNVNLYQALKLWNKMLDDPATKTGMEQFYMRGPHAVDASYIKKDYEGYGLENLRLLTTPDERPAQP